LGATDQDGDIARLSETVRVQWCDGGKRSRRVVIEICLGGGKGILRVLSGIRIISPFTISDEVGESYSRQNTEDRYYDHELYEGKSLVMRRFQKRTSGKKGYNGLSAHCIPSIRFFSFFVTRTRIS
jgi:hypothetical protein